MKYFMTAFFFLQISISCFSQFKTIGESSAFEEPEDGYAKLLQLKNGNTIFLHINVKEGIAVTIYDASHREITSKAIETKYTKGKNKSVEAVFEINGDVVVMVSEIDGDPSLYRIVIDGKTGNAKQNEKIAQAMKIDWEERYAMAFARAPRPDFFIRKDPNSDYYAVAMANRFLGDYNRRIEIIRYGPDNKEINRAFHNLPGDKSSHLLYLDMTVIGKEKVSLFASTYDTHADDNEVLIANFDAGAKDLSIQKLPFTNEIIITYGLAKYIPVTKNILFLAIAQAGKKKNEFGTVLAFIDPFEKKLHSASVVFPEKINAKSEEIFGKKNGFEGIPQNIFVKEDGSFTIVYEEVKNFSQIGANGSSAFNEIGNIGICKYDAAGKELESYLVPKNQRVYGFHLQPFYQADWVGSATQLLVGNQYKSFAFIEGKGKSYVMFNDIEKNAESAKKGKVTTIQGIKDCNGFYFRLDGPDMMPGREFVFGKSGAKDEHDLAVFTISDYNRDQNIYTTLKLEKESRSHEVKVVWLQPE